jgi:glycine cleavage system aminomethyltransferase T
MIIPIIGKISSAVYSPRLKKNIALAMVDIDYSEIGNKFEVTADDKKFNCTIVEKPFYDPKKKIASS